MFEAVILGKGKVSQKLEKMSQTISFILYFFWTCFLHSIYKKPADSHYKKKNDSADSHHKMIFSLPVLIKRNTH